MTDKHHHTHLFSAGDARATRDRRRALEGDLGRAGPAPSRTTPMRLVQIYNGGAMGSQPNLVYLAHPVELDGAESEGGSGTPLADPSLTIPLVVLGHPPAAGDILQAVAIAGRWVAQRGAAPQTTSIQLIGCSGPLSGVSISVYTKQGGTLIFSGTTPSSGIVGFSIPASGVYWIVTSAPTSFPYNRYAWGSQGTYLIANVVNLLAPGPAAGFTCCSAIGYPIQSTLYLTVCGQTYTLSTASAAGSKFAFAFKPTAISTGGVAVDNGTCSWSGYPGTASGETLWSVGLNCPTSSTAMAGLITTSGLGHFNTAKNSYDAFALCPTSCKPTQVCQSTPLALSGTVGQTISLSGTMPATVVGSCTPGVSPYAMPCAGASITVTS